MGCIVGHLGTKNALLSFPVLAGNAKNHLTTEESILNLDVKHLKLVMMVIVMSKNIDGREDPL